MKHLPSVIVTALYIFMFLPTSFIYTRTSHTPSIYQTTSHLIIYQITRTCSPVVRRPPLDSGRMGEGSSAVQMAIPLAVRRHERVWGDLSSNLSMFIIFVSCLSTSNYLRFTSFLPKFVPRLLVIAESGLPRPELRRISLPLYSATSLDSSSFEYYGRVA
jgi:hypothetical protein